jgi:predicted AlkP superfamily phosphohydrolase/phosphomutase
MDDENLNDKKEMSRRSALKTLVGGALGAAVVGITATNSDSAPAKQKSGKGSAAAKKPKIVLFGLDSCNMEKIIEWTKQGKLPTFKKLLAQGSYGEFENIFRGMSVDAWAAYNTGVGPGQNNYFGSHPWQLYDRTAYQTSGINRLFRLHVATVPFMLAEAGVKVGLCGTAMSYPPERLKDGFMMSGKGAPGLGDAPATKGHVYYTQEKHRAAAPLKTKIEFKDGTVSTVIRLREMKVPLTLKLNPGDTVTIAYNDVKVTLKEGQWSQYVPIKFPNGRSAIVRWKPERLSTAEGDLQLYRYRLLQDPSAPERHEPIDPFFDGACVPSDRWTYPASLQKEVYNAVGYYRTPNLPFEYDYSSFVGFVQEEETLIEDCYDATREQDDIALWLMKNKPWDFFWFSNMPYDRLNHNMTRVEGNPDWSEEYEEKYGKDKVMLEFTQYIDKELARILKELPKDACFIMISDHACGAVKKDFQPNTWLKKLGLLHVKPEVDGKKRKYDADDIDWSRTKAYTSWNPGIFINLKGREPNGIVEYNEYEKLRDFIIAELKKLKDPEGNQYTHIADRVENIYKGDYGWYAGDVQFCGYRDSSGIKVPGKKNDGLYQINFGGFGRDEAIWDNPMRHFTGFHGNALTSFIAVGPGIKKNNDVSKGGHMMNVMPTIMHMYGLTPPSNFEGRIMTEIFEPGSPFSRKG